MTEEKKETTETGKPKVAFHDITGCQGCVLSVIFNEDELLDIINAVDIKEFRFIMGEKYDGPLDICFIEGAVVNKEDEEMVKKLRERSKVVVALGACATHGNIPSLKNWADPKNLERLQYQKKHEQMIDVPNPMPITKFIKVEYSLPGCPPDRDEIKKFVKEILLGKQFYSYPDPVCRECRLFENGCLLDEGKVCLGPITRGGCRAVCCHNGFECYGCRGITDDAQFEEYFKLMEEKGIDATTVKKHMETFAGVEINEALEKIQEGKWAKLH
ncbi:cytochrome B [Candidatus Woesearchaeota archaeon]|nr:cytochrome B [Candidatus Woesearchaeota archaeon]